MDLKNLNMSYGSLKKEGWILRLTLAGESVALAVLAFMVLNQKTVTTIVPWTMQHTAYVSQDMASESYKVSWAMALAMLFGNCNYGSVQNIESRIAPLLPNDSYQSTMTALRAQVQQYKENRITVRFEIEKYTYEPSTDKVFVEGSYYIKAPGIAEKKHKRCYEFVIGTNDYMPQILWMNTYADKARTQQYLKELKDHHRSGDKNKS